MNKLYNPSKNQSSRFSIKKLYKLTNIKLNQSFWIIIAAFVLQIVAGVIISLTMPIMQNSANPTIVSTLMYFQASYEMQYVSATLSSIMFGILISIFAILRCDLKYYMYLGINQKQNSISNICVGASLSVSITLIFIISQIINLLTVRTMDGYWLSAIADNNMAGKIAINAMLCMLATFTIYMLLISLKQLFARSPRICIIVSAAIIILAVLFITRVIFWQSLRELIFTYAGGCITLVIFSMIFTASYCCLSMKGEVKR